MSELLLIFTPSRLLSNVFPARLLVPLSVASEAPLGPFSDSIALSVAGVCTTDSVS